MKFKTLNYSPVQALEEEGWQWVLGEDTLPYVVKDLVIVSEAEAEAYYEAANELYTMFTAAAQHVIDHDLYEELGIPSALVPLIRYTWENDKAWHLYGRFDLSGGLDGRPVKLIEFNADTATCIPETASIQWASLKTNGLGDSSQFNVLYETLVETFREIRVKNSDKEPAILFSNIKESAEDISNIEMLMEAAREAGFEVAHEFIDSVEFSSNEGVYKQELATGSFIRYDFWFKLVPWEYLAWDEPELSEILIKLAFLNKTIIINPAYTLLFQSKGILKILWDLYPHHPLLLEADYKLLKNKIQVEKVMLGREGANVRVLGIDGCTANFTSGEYGDQKVIYQEYVDFLKDSEGYNYQAGVFYSGEGCGLGFRRGGVILDNRAQFCGHIIAKSAEI